MWVSEEIRKAILQGLKDIDRTDVWYCDKHAKAEWEKMEDPTVETFIEELLKKYGEKKKVVKVIQADDPYER